MRALLRTTTEHVLDFTHVVNLVSTISSRRNIRFFESINIRTIVMLPSYRRILYRNAGLFYSIRHRPKRRLPSFAEDERENPSLKNDSDIEQTFFPVLSRLGIITTDKIHQLSVKCEDAMHMIHFGAVHKSIVMQYCHYLAHLCREGIDQDYYSEKCFDLSTYLLKNSQDLPPLNIDNLLCDIASSSSRNCASICDRLVSLQRLQGLNSQQIESLLDACYKFNMWDKANYLLGTLPSENIKIGLVDRLTSRIIDTTKEYENLQDEYEKNRLRYSIITQLVSVVEICQKNKLYFFTQHRDRFIKALTDLGLDVNVNTTIKLSGRCVNCNNHLPLYDGGKIKALNSDIEKLMHKGSDKGLYYYTNPKELPRFKEYIKHILAEDKRAIGYVIDGLNIAYKNTTGFNFYTVKVTDEVSRTVKKHRPESKSQVLINTILRSNMIGEKILVIGKHHMLRWPGLINFFDKYKISYFFPSDTSEDDLFQLYAATLSPKTLLVSSDCYRNFQDAQGITFKQEMREWLDTHQVIVNRENLKGLLPTPFLKYPSVHKASKSMHLPIVDYTINGEGEPPLPLNRKALKWVCCRYENIANTETETMAT